jgi:transcriptional regulator with XRE-family HTH domain
VERLRYIREQAGYSQPDLAEISGVAQGTISDIELGKRKARGRTLRKLARALNVEVAELYGDSPHPLEEAPAASQPSLDDALEVDRRFQVSQLRQLEMWKGYLEGYARRWETEARNPELVATPEAAAGASVEANKQGIYIFQTIRSCLIPTIQDLFPEEIARVQMAELEALVNRLNDALVGFVDAAGRVAASQAAWKAAEQEHVATVTDIRERLSA